MLCFLGRLGCQSVGRLGMRGGKTRDGELSWEGVVRFQDKSLIFDFGCCDQKEEMNIG